jgi:CRP-like cAMP-binding protein
MHLQHSRNLLLAQLTPDDHRRLSPHFEYLSMAYKQGVFEQRGPVDHVYFPESGVLSLVTDLDNGQTIETGTIGYEGFVGLPAVLGVERASGRAFCQVPGEAWRVRTEVIAEERRRSTSWFLVLLRYANFVATMAAQSAACNRTHAIDARMSRWLLMTHDRVDSDEFPLTQEFLSHMIGAPRSTVNIAGATLQKAGFIKYSRGRITVTDRRGLETASCECYGQIRQELEDTIRGAASLRRNAVERAERGEQAEARNDP